MSKQVSRGSDGDYQADEQAGVKQLRWRLSGRRGGRCRAAQLLIIKQMNIRYHEAQLAKVKQKFRQVSRGSAGVYQEDEQAGVTRLSWPQ